jgi:hypothetical protein
MGYVASDPARSRPGARSAVRVTWWLNVILRPRRFMTRVLDLADALTAPD